MLSFSGRVYQASVIILDSTLSASPEKWSNTLKQIVGNLATICLSVFDYFMNLALKGLNSVLSFTSKLWKPPIMFMTYSCFLLFLIISEIL